MADFYDYFKWRGDLSLSKIPLNEIDALVLSTLSYLDFEGLVKEKVEEGTSLLHIAKAYEKMESTEGKYRVKNDLKLLQAAAATERFGNLKFTFYRNRYDEKKETQFAAVTSILDENTAVIIFRGTDLTLAGWKEDFNMSFMDLVPAQEEAVCYVEEFSKEWKGNFYITGHSKGGNLAVYGAVKCREEIKDRILRIYNQDGPGFSKKFLEQEAYQKILPKIITYVPHSSVVGMIFEHEEQYQVVKSKQFGLLQHDPYTWELEGPAFILMEEITESSKLIDQVLKRWLEEMTIEERGDFVDTIYEILTQNGQSHLKDLFHPQHLPSYFGAITDGKKRSILHGELKVLMNSIRKSAGKKNQN